MFLSKTTNAQWYANSSFRYYVEDGDTIQYIPQVNVRVLLSDNIMMANSDLQTWGADDNVAIDWVINELNLTKK